MLPFQFRRSFRRKFLLKLFLAALLSLIANLCFFESMIGWTAGALGIAVLTAIILTRPIGVASYLGVGLGVSLCISLFDHPTLYKGLLLWLLLSSISLQGRKSGVLAVLDTPLASLKQSFLGCWSAIPVAKALHRTRFFKNKHVGTTKLQHLVLPGLFLLFFVLLFRIANPLFDRMISNFSFEWVWDLFDPARIGFFIICSLLALGLLRPHIRLVRSKSPTEDLEGDDPALVALFSEMSLVYSLVVFNALFAIQNFSDVAFLWAGVVLPDGMTYAEYAHRGAYPLVLTTLIAAGFVLLSSQFGSNSRVKLLTLIWLIQNVFLTLSAAFRTLAYIDVYALTLLRLSALIWMVLVAIGLILLFQKILQAKSSRWLIQKNLIALVCILNLCAFVDLSAIVAHHNVRHAKEVTGRGIQIDITYLESLGPSSIPALVWLEGHKLDYRTRLRLRRAISNLEFEINERQGDRRGWTLKNARHQALLERRHLVKR